jgi:DnaJ family protein C protein 12
MYTFKCVFYIYILILVLKLAMMLQSMHWSTFKTKDRMLPESSGGGAVHSGGQTSAAQRRASEGGANIHWGARGNVQWDSEASSEVVNRFRNYEI